MALQADDSDNTVQTPRLVSTSPHPQSTSTDSLLPLATQHHTFPSTLACDSSSFYCDILGLQKLRALALWVKRQKSIVN